jgi:hypothetical protein
MCNDIEMIARSHVFLIFTKNKIRNQTNPKSILNKKVSGLLTSPLYVIAVSMRKGATDGRTLYISCSGVSSLSFL